MMDGWYKEITKWDTPTPNHTYYVVGDRLLKFKASGSDNIVDYTVNGGKGLRFYKARRKFVKLSGEKWK